MSDALRSKLIRLAAANRDLRPHLLPVLAAGVMPGTPGEESWQSGERAPDGWTPGYDTEHGTGHGEGSQTPPARDEDGNLLPMKEAANPISRIEIQPLLSGKTEHVRVSIYDSKGKQHNDLPLKNLESYLTKTLLMPRRAAGEIKGMVGNKARVRIERRGDKWGRVQVIRKATWEGRLELHRRAALFRHLMQMADETPGNRERVAALLMARATMSEGTFWDVVKEIGWDRNRDPKRIKKRLLALWTPEQAEAARDAFAKLQGRLYSRLDKWQREDWSDAREFGLGDDGFGDLIAHIIGLGKREYDAVMKDPQRALERAHRGDFEESFSYALPWRDDYENLNVSKYVKWAKTMVAEYEEASKEEAFKPLRSKIYAMQQMLEMLADHEDWSGFLATEEQGKALAAELEEKGRKLYEAHVRRTNPHAYMTWDGGNPMFNKWAVWNLYSDIRDYLT